MSVLRIEPNAINPASSYTFGNVSVTGNILVTGNIIPTSNNTVNLGDPNHRFGTLYISANTIDLGGATITGTGDTIQFVTNTGNLVVDANTISFLSNISSQGAESARGYTGSAGINGFTGSKGSDGYTGSAGPTGFTGSIGSVGFVGSKGDTGLGFTIAKTYANVAALTADASPTGITSGQFALVDTGNVEDPENSRLYLWTGSAYNYVNDLSGAAGITGPQGNAGYTGSIGYTGSAAAGSGNVLVASNVAPTSPSIGSQWFDTSSNVIYQYVTDGVSNQWIDISTGLGVVTSGGGSGSGTVGYTYSGTTNNANETEIFINGTAGNRYAIDANSSVGYEVNIVGRNSDGSAHAYFKLQGLARNNAGNVQDVGALAETIIARTYNNWLVDARADDTNNSLNIYVQGSSGNTITWSATMTVTET